MRAKYFWIKPDAGHPIGKKSGVLTGGHGPALSTSGEQVLTRLLVGCFQIVVDSLTGLIRQLELHWSPCLPLPHGRTIDCIAIRSDITDLQGDEIATTELAVDGKVEQGKVTGPFLD